MDGLPQERPPETAEHPDDATDERVREVIDLIESGQRGDLELLLVNLHPSDTAQVLELVSPDQRRILMDVMRPTFDAEILAYLPVDLREEVIGLLDPGEVAAAVAELDTDDAVDVLQDLDQDAQREILENLPPETRALVEEGLNFPEYSAGRLMSRSFVAVPEFWTVGRLIDFLRSAAEDEDAPEQFYDVFVVDPTRHVVGSVPLARVLKAKRTVKLNTMLNEDIHRIPAEMDQEEVARQFRKYALVSAPVVDAEGRLIGAITVDDVVDVIEEEAEADLLALGGVGEGDLYRAVLDTTKSRFSWLAVNLLTAVLASAVIGLFEATLQQIVALAVLMPIVASMGGNAGTQTLTVAVRALATRELTDANAFRVVGKEILVGAVNGLLFAIIAGVVAWAWFGDPMIGVVIAAAMVVNLICAGAFGALIPLGLNRIGVDPAVSSSVFLTTVTDVVGFFAFLGLASLAL